MLVQLAVLVYAVTAVAVGDRLARRRERRERIPGGLASGRGSSDFDRRELRRGTEVELEHTVGGGRGSRAIAREIAMDHLAEDPMYYRKLRKAGL